MPGGRPPSDPIKRFMEKVKQAESGCIEWQAGLARGGYGKFQYTGKTMAAHRVSYIFFRGEIPAGMCVMHKCDNRLCVNPQHLVLGTDAENVEDMDTKGRRGTKSQLTRAQAAQILELLASGMSQAKVGEMFGVHQTVVSRIKLGQTTKFKE